MNIFPKLLHTRKTTFLREINNKHEVGIKMYLAAAFKPDALCTWTTSVTEGGAAPPPACAPNRTGRCLYRMHTSSKPEQGNGSDTWLWCMWRLLGHIYKTSMSSPEGWGWNAELASVLGTRDRENISASLRCVFCMVTMAHSLDKGSNPLATSWSLTFG